jgi:hypothetical protein
MNLLSGGKLATTYNNDAVRADSIAHYQILGLECNPRRIPLPYGTHIQPVALKEFPTLAMGEIEKTHSARLGLCWTANIIIYIITVFNLGKPPHFLPTDVSEPHVDNYLLYLTHCA